MRIARAASAPADRSSEKDGTRRSSARRRVLHAGRRLRTFRRFRAYEEFGRILGAEAVCVSDRAHERGRDQLGTRGAGNHFPAPQESSQSQEICSRSRFTPAVEGRGILICAGSMPGLAEEAPIAYEDVSRVVEVVHNPGNCEENCETGAHCRNQKVKMLERLRRATP